MAVLMVMHQRLVGMFVAVPFGQVQGNASQGRARYSRADSISGLTSASSSLASGHHGKTGQERRG